MDCYSAAVVTLTLERLRSASQWQIKELLPISDLFSFALLVKLQNWSVQQYCLKIAM